MGGETIVWLLGAVALALTVALALHVRGSADDAAYLRRIMSTGLLALPGGMVLYFSFTAGGFFPDAPAFAALVLIVVLVLWITLAEQPFAAIGRGLALAAAALALYTLWTLASALWSDAPARALVEADRSLVYLLTFVLFGSLGRSSERLASMLRGVALAMVVVSVAGLLTRLLPEVFPTAVDYRNERLSHPLTYWNALGLTAALAAIFCLHLTTSVSGSRAVRVLAAGALPLVCTTLFFTFSRGAIAVGALGVLVYLLLGRPRGMLTGSMAVVPLSAFAVAQAYRADALTSAYPTTAEAVRQGQDVAVTVFLCAVAAVVVRTLALPLDRRFERMRIRPRAGGRPVATAATVAVATALVLVVALDVPQRFSEQYQRFAGGLVESDDPRERLDNLSSNGRVEHWAVGLEGYTRAEVRGMGAGTFGLLWSRERPPSAGGAVVEDAHSLYVETLAELGVVGFALLATTLAMILLALAPIRRGADRALSAALFAGALAWGIHAGVDWDWEMPAITAWLFALGGMAMAERVDRPSAAPPSRKLRVAVGLGVLLSAVGPGLILVSEKRLDRAVAAYERGDCDRAIDEAASSVAALDIRPEPYEVIGYCQSRRGFHRLAADALSRAVALDPDNWEFHYGLAVVSGAGGMDPRPAARTALRLNPRNPLVRDLVEDLGDSDDWRRVTTPLTLGQGLAAVR